MKTRFLLLVVVTSLSTLVHAQWYFETGVNDAKFTEYVSLSGTKTTLHSYSGLRDLSNSVGYVFSFKSLDERAEVDARTAKLRLAVGLGFDQMNLRTQADFSGYKVPVHYNMSQVQGKLNLLFTPNLLKKKRPDALGIRRPALNLLLEGGLSYGLFTNAVRTYTTNRGFINDLKEDSEFNTSYPAYSFGGGLEFPLNRHTVLYGKYTVENAFSIKESNKDTYRVAKNRVMIGLRTDFKLANRLRNVQEERIAALEARGETKQKPVDLSPLYDKIRVLEKAVNTHKHDYAKVNQSPQKVKKHDNGFLYLPDFKHVLFPLNSASFDYSKYKQPLIDLASFIKAHPQFNIKLVGYADSITGNQEFNKTLSENRAKRVYNHLRSLGVAPERMLQVGGGETLQFGTDNQLTENRRTEIIILAQ